MIHARQCLLGRAREFFDSLAGLYRWDDVNHHEAEFAPESNGRRNPLGKYREKVVISFDEFRLEVASPEESPPLGSVKLFIHDQLAAEGSLDAAVWAKIGTRIKEKCRVSG